MVSIVDALEQLSVTLEDIGGCGDSDCMILVIKGQVTNGGCRCYSNKNKMMRYLRASRRFHRDVASWVQAVREAKKLTL